MNAGCLDFLVKFRPQYGYFADPSKSHYICKLEDENKAKLEFDLLGLEINFSWGERYLGGFIVHWQWCIEEAMARGHGGKMGGGG